MEMTPIAHIRSDFATKFGIPRQSCLVEELAARVVFAPGYRDASALRGMVTDRDIVLRCVAAEEDPAQTPVRDIMTRSCATVAPGDDCREATRLMARHQVRRLPVVEGGRLVGVISLSDLARSGRFDMEAAQALSEISENIIVR